MKKKVQLLWEKFSGRRQFEESHKKKHEEKLQFLWENVSDHRQFEETHTKNT